MSKSIVQSLVVLLVGLGLVAWAGMVGVEHLCGPRKPPVDRAHVAEWVARLQDRDPMIRAEARRNVATLGEPAIPLLLPLLDGDDQVGKHAATDALLTMQGEAAVPALICLVKKGTPSSCRAAIEALGLMGRRANAAVPVLQELVQSKQLHRVQKLGGICFVPMTLVRIQGAAAVPLLIEMLEDPELRVEVADALENVGEAALAALPALEAAARSESPENRQIIHTNMDWIRLSGSWEMTAVERGGKAIPVPKSDPAIHWVIDNNTWQKGPIDGSKTTGNLSIDATHMPLKLDLSEQAGDDGNTLGRYFIYEITGDTLKICGVENSSDPRKRPTAFDRAQEPDVVIVHWKRVKRNVDAAPLGRQSVEKGLRRIEARHSYS